jgi:hypothetical protein
MQSGEPIGVTTVTRQIDDKSRWQLISHLVAISYLTPMRSESCDRVNASGASLNEKSSQVKSSQVKVYNSTLQEELDLVTTLHTAVQCTANTNGITVFSTHTQRDRRRHTTSTTIHTLMMLSASGGLFLDRMR